MRSSLPLIATGLLISSFASAAERAPDANRAARSSLQSVLGAEQHGRDVDRSKRLQSAVRQSPDFAPARWQSGHVKSGRKWVRFDRVSRMLSDDATRTQYRGLRDAAPNTVAGQMRLADWCRKHDLPQQRRAHLTAVLEIQPNHSTARKLLGHVRVGASWISKRQLRQNRQHAAQTLKELKRWTPRLKSIRDGLLSRDRGRVETARKRLYDLDDPTAIPAVEVSLAHQNPMVSRIVAQFLGSVPHQRATMALARQALFSRWKSAREAAVDQLKTRKPENFVPQVLSLTSTPITAKRLLYFDGHKHFVLRSVFDREERGRRWRAVDDRRYRRWLHTWSNSIATLDYGERGRGSGHPGRAGIPANASTNRETSRYAQQRILRQDSKIDDQNRWLQTLNARAGELLSAVSGVDLGDDPKQFWDWWDAYTGVWNPGSKDLITKYTKSKSPFPIHEYKTVSHSCLAAGTPVWTDRGPVAIEKVRIGDCVLAKNVETGELAYKPVLKTTVRPKIPLLKLDVGPRTINVTGGHPFWISGKGWMKARDIKTGMRMHDVMGTTAVRPGGTATAEPTYNLIVADFHTYFVGEAKVLSHDNTPIEPTDALVPGLASK